MIVGLGVPGLLRVRDRNQRIACSYNLAQLGQGLAAYAATFNDNLPFTGWTRTAAEASVRALSWQPTSDPDVVFVPNRRHMYPLLRAGLVADPVRFLCPAQACVPMPVDQINGRVDFLNSRNVSYVYQNMAGVRPTMSTDPDLPIMADENPLFGEDGLVLGLGSGADSNSRAHGRSGQNVLTLGGRVKWSSAPDCGIDGDNIWTLRGVARYTGREGPQSATDSHLLK